MGMQEKLQELRNGFETAYIDKTSTSNLAYKPQFVSNDYKQGKKVLSSIEDELMTCDQFQISVAFITMGGITPLLQILQELEEKGIYFSESRNLQDHHRKLQYNKNSTYYKPGMEYTNCIHQPG